jgi:hypothetical protein
VAKPTPLSDRQRGDTWWAVQREVLCTLIHIQRAHVTMTYNVINMSPKMATNTTHLTDPLTSASMSCLDLSNKSVRHLLVYGAGAGSLQFSKLPVPFSMVYARNPRIQYQFFVTYTSTGLSFSSITAMWSRAVSAAYSISPVSL